MLLILYNHKRGFVQWRKTDGEKEPPGKRWYNESMLEKNLEKYFNFAEFRAGQKEVVEAILRGEDVVALMPTGGGKSLCYQLPAILSEKVTVVISPLIALMKDQVDSLGARGIAATFINSSLEQSEIKKRIADLRSGKIKILYAAPERFGNAEFRQLFAELEIALLAVDEAHCVSQWGHDFRPDYLEIKNYIRTLKKRPTVAAFTATATPEVKEDIIRRLELREPQVFVRGFDRPNLKFFTQRELKPRQREKEILRVINSVKGAGIVYALSRKNTEEIAKYLRENKISAAAYHAGMSGVKREKIQNEFMDNKIKVIVATIAFGMGVDKSDVRFVIHAGMPGSLEGYYQEAGRAGRDGETAYCILLHSKKDSSLHQFFIRQNRQLMAGQGKSWDEINKITDIKYNRLNRMTEYTLGARCRRQIILEYFDDPDLQNKKENCQGCDVCLKWKKKENAPLEGAAAEEDNDELSHTVLETAKLYRKNYAPAQIAKIRGLGVRTIFEHLIRWYALGGELAVEKFVSLAEESLILTAIAAARAEKPHSLKAIKERLPDNIGYEQIKMILAKLGRE